MPAESPLARKLLIKSGNRLALLFPPPGYPEQLEPLPAGVELTGPDGTPADQVQLFVRDLDSLRREAPAALSAVRPGGIVWIVYPKQTSGIKTDINRDTCWAALQESGWRPVTQVAVDDVWSALRFRPVNDVGKPKRG